MALSSSVEERGIMGPSTGSRAPILTDFNLVSVGSDKCLTIAVAVSNEDI